MSPGQCCCLQDKEMDWSCYNLVNLSLYSSCYSSVIDKFIHYSTNFTLHACWSSLLYHWDFKKIRRGLGKNDFYVFIYLGSEWVGGGGYKAGINQVEFQFYLVNHIDFQKKKHESFLFFCFFSEKRYIFICQTSLQHCLTQYLCHDPSTYHSFSSYYCDHLNSWTHECEHLTQLENMIGRYHFVNFEFHKDFT